MKAKEAYDKMQKARQLTKGSFCSLMEEIYDQIKAKRQHYHGGDFNGVSCRIIMREHRDLIRHIKDLAVIIKGDDADSNEMEEFLDTIGQLLHTLDYIWASVRGVEMIDPSAEQLRDLKSACAIAETHWNMLELSVTPKAHLMFHHLVDQMGELGGLADMPDDLIEFEHQRWKKLKQRTCNIRNFEQQNNCQLVYHRMHMHPDIKAIIEDFEGSRQRNFSESTKRKREEKSNQARAVKLAFRRTCLPTSSNE
jgi:hypothetical protein